MTFDAVREAYGARSAEYIARFGTIESVAAADRRLVLDWARSLSGRVLDVGCGPGQWTDLLREAGVDAEGIDPVAEFVDGARAAYPRTGYREGRAEDLGVADEALGGVLAWYSLIYASPGRIGAALTEFARAIRPGGGLLFGFFSGAELEAFDHAVAPAYFWPVEELRQRVEAVGFRVEHAETRIDDGARPHGALVAHRRLICAPHSASI